MKLEMLFLFFFFSLSLTASILRVEPDTDSLAPHKTSAFRFTTEPKPLVVRRGFSFTLRVTTDSRLQTGEYFAVSFSPATLWVMVTVQKSSDTVYLVTLASRTTAPVMEYSMQVNILRGGSYVSQFSYPGKLVVLFNPYNPQDQTYMPRQADLREYLENEYGTVWQGTSSNHYPQRWYYGQFNENSLKTAMYVMKSFTGDASDPVAVARYLTFATCAQYNSPGILIGNWGSNFQDGTSPLAWTGSSKILDQYVSSGFKPVKYAQCWVFGGVMNTLMRTLGLPGRQLITFGSAHEQARAGAYRQVIEYHYNSDLQYVYATGSVWNFHSWNEVWINWRADGSSGGWQAVDATPQELSDGQYRLGPAATDDIKNMNLNARYDASFVRSETASALQFWQDDCSSNNQGCRPVKLLSTDYQSVGNLIITPTIGDANAQQEITWNYKNKQTKRSSLAVEEQLMVYSPGCFASNSTSVCSVSPTQMFAIETQLLQIEAGQDLKFWVRVIGLKQVELSVVVNIGAYITSYTGEVAQRLPSFQKQFDLKNCNGYALSKVFEISVNAYQPLIDATHNHLMFTFFGKLNGAESEMVVIQRPAVLTTQTLKFVMASPVGEGSVSETSVVGGAQGGAEDREGGGLSEGLGNLFGNSPMIVSKTRKSMMVSVSFTNPYNLPLKQVVLRFIQGDDDDVGVKEEEIFVGEIPPKEKFTQMIEVTFSRPGAHSLIANLISDRLNSRGFVDFTVDE